MSSIIYIYIQNMDQNELWYKIINFSLIHKNNHDTLKVSLKVSKIKGKKTHINKTYKDE